jgi:hypothetical protein
MPCEQKYPGHIPANWFALFLKANCHCAIGGSIWLAVSRCWPADDLAGLDHPLHANMRELIAATRYRCPLDRPPASRLLPPRSGLERSDFVRWLTAVLTCEFDPLAVINRRAP